MNKLSMKIIQDYQGIFIVDHLKKSIVYDTNTDYYNSIDIFVFGSVDVKKNIFNNKKQNKNMTMYQHPRK